MSVRRSFEQEYWQGVYGMGGCQCSGVFILLCDPKIYKQRWRTPSSACFAKFLQVPPSSYFSLRNVSQCLEVPPNSSKFLPIPSTPTNNFCVTPLKNKCLYKTAITFWPIVQTDHPWHYLCRNLSGNFLLMHLSGFKRTPRMSIKVKNGIIWALNSILNQNRVARNWNYYAGLLHYDGCINKRWQAFHQISYGRDGLIGSNATGRQISWKCIMHVIGLYFWYFTMFTHSFYRYHSPLCL